MSRLSYLVKRAGIVARQLSKPRGLVLLLGLCLGTAAVLTSGWLSAVLGVAALFTFAGAIFLLSASQAEDRVALYELATQPRPAAGLDASYAPSTVDWNPVATRRRRLAEATEAIGRARAVLSTESAAGSTGLQLPSRASRPSASPLVTVVVPCFNEERFIGDTLLSVRRQWFTDWECIVVDDASTDGSVSRLAPIVEGDPRFRLVRHHANGGLSASRNTGIRLARGALITFLDGDDLLMEASLVDRVDALTSRTDADIAGSFCGVRLLPESVALAELPPFERWSRREDVDFASDGFRCPFNAHAPLLWTDVVRSAGGFDERMTRGVEDWDLWYRLMRNGYRFIPSNLQTAGYRQKSTSMAKTHAQAHVAVARGVIDAAFLPVAGDVLWESGLEPYDRPWQEYRRLREHNRRAIQYAATAMLGGDAESARAIVSGMEPVPRSFLDNHIEPEERIRDGFRRALGMDGTDIAALDSELQPLTNGLMAMLGGMERAGGGDAERKAPPTVDVVFAVTSAADVDRLRSVAEGLPPELTHRFVDLERCAGPQGGSSALADRGIAAHSVNSWVLGGGGAGVIVACRPLDPMVAELAAHHRGAAVIAVERDDDDVVALGCSTVPPPAAAIRAGRAGTGQLASILAASSGIDPGVPDPWVEWRTEESIAREEHLAQPIDIGRLREFKDIHKGERCVIIGNGPSLNELDLTKLAAERTFAVNGIFYAADRMGFAPTYYVVEDSSVMAENTEQIRAYAAGHRFFPSIYRRFIGDRDDATYFLMNRGFYEPTSPNYCVPKFSTDITQRVYSGQSVTIINLQLAYYMGFAEVILIGMDFSYTIPEGAAVDGDIITSTDDDPNHFHPAYFGTGKTWKSPKLDRVLANYALAKRIYQSDGRRIVNASAGGKLELFDRVRYDELFG